MCQLTVYYDLKRDDPGDRLVFRDDEIMEIAGVKITSAGCGTRHYVRDVQLEFENESALLTAKAELREAGFRFGSFCEPYSEACGI